ncbi:MAG: tRNA pseudouridine(55) synthase TruB [Actinomycetota bacterium]
MSAPAVSGLLLVDKPAGLTSHDVVARVRRLAGTRRVGHAGTLDPMATGLLVIGMEKATRLLGHLAGHDKDYTGTLVLGQSTSTDDAEGSVVASADVSGVTDQAIAAAAASLVGHIMQVPPAVSAIKVDGVRSYARARRGEHVDLPARPVHVASFDVLAVRRVPGVIEVDVAASVGAGTYIRGLARDVGAALGVGGHLSALRRTRIGGYRLAEGRALSELEALSQAGEFGAAVLPLADAVAAAFPRRDVDAETAVKVGHGGTLPAAGFGPGPVGIFGPDGDVLALMEEHGDTAAALCVFIGG